MYIDKKVYNWNPWDTDPYELKRPCHIAGLRKMDEYSRQRDRMDSDKRRTQGGIKHTAGGKSYSKEYAKLYYRDEDMNVLATQNKGTTSSYDYTG